MAGADTGNGSLSVVTEHGPCASRVRMARRVESDSAPKTMLSGSLACIGDV